MNAELKQALTDAGAEFHDQGKARHFGDTRQEYDALVSGAGLVELSDRTQIELTGEDRVKLLHNLSTNEVRELAPGSGCETFLTNVQGRVVAYVFVFAGAKSLVLDSAPGQAEAILAHLDRYLIREDVQLHDRSAEWSELLLAGSGAAERLAACSGGAVPEKLYDHLEGSIGDKTVWLRRVSLTGPESFEVSCMATDAAAVWRALREAGAAPCGAEAFEMARVEAGSPIYGRDIDERNLPQEVDRNDQAISFVKGCYVGQETVARIDALGHVNWLLRGLKFAGGEAPAVGTELEQDGKKVARVGSSVFSPRLEAPLALGYVRRGKESPGTKLETNAGTAEVVSLPVGS